MPGYKAIITGENFEFLIDDEPHHLDFIRTVFVEAENETSAQEVALNVVRADLMSQSLLDDDSEQVISLDILHQVDDSVSPVTDDFIWSFPGFEDID